MNIEIIEKEKRAEETAFVVGGVYAYANDDGSFDTDDLRLIVDVGEGAYTAVTLDTGENAVNFGKTMTAEEMRQYVKTYYTYVPNAKLVVEVD